MTAILALEDCWSMSSFFEPPPPPPETPPARPILGGGGGGGGDGEWHYRYWVWPLPPEGPLAFVCEWPIADIPETRTEIDSALLRDAAADAITVWPENEWVNNASPFRGRTASRA